jgi:hypothetical protein
LVERIGEEVEHGPIVPDVEHPHVFDGGHVSDDPLDPIAVSTGSRISSLAGRSQVLVSDTVKGLVAGSGFTFEDAGEHELKGVPERWHLYRVVA